MHELYDQMLKLGVLSEDISLYCERTRDNASIKALRCNKSGVIFLDSIDHVVTGHYEHRRERPTVRVYDREIDVNPPNSDIPRRAREIQSHATNDTIWLDFGCGNGELLRSVSDINEKFGLDINPDRIHHCRQLGLNVVESLEHLDAAPSLVSLFHVLEHLADPVGTLRALLEITPPNATILIEVPHARDALLTVYSSNAYKRFTIWSEHLILHTRSSLERIVKEAALGVDVKFSIQGIQRYPLSNHLYWLSKGKPGGHNAIPILGYESLKLYEKELRKVDATDTLFCIVKKVGSSGKFVGKKQPNEG